MFYMNLENIFFSLIKKINNEIFIILFILLFIIYIIYYLLFI